jgi:hypothetical protein
MSLVKQLRDQQQADARADRQHADIQVLQARLTSIEEERRLDERAPVVQAKFDLDDAGDYCVRLVVTSGRPLDRVEWSFDPNRELHPVVSMGRARQTMGQNFDLTPGRVLTLPVDLDPRAPDGTLHLRCSFYAGADRWDHVVQVVVTKPRPHFAY